MLRPLRDQFESETVDRIQTIQARVRGVKSDSHVIRYLHVELANALEAGLLVCAVVVARVCLEVGVRDLLVAQRSRKIGIETRAQRKKLERSVEESRNLMFVPMISELTRAEVLSRVEADRLCGVYKDIRIPLSHGLTGRYVRQRNGTRRFLEDVGLASDREFENLIEASSLDEIEELVEAIIFIRDRSVRE